MLDDLDPREDRLSGDGRSVGPTVHWRIRDAQKQDARRIAELFRISSDGYADYVWRKHQVDHPGLSPLEIGQRRYERDDAAFSYRNCMVIVCAAEVVGMMHAFVMPTSEPDAPPERDPVLAPVAALEVPGSLYLSGLAILAVWRGCGLGSALLDAARARARKLGCDRLSLICFEQNDRAMRLYRRQGFYEIDRRTIVPHPLIRRSGDAVLMVANVLD